MALRVLLAASVLGLLLPSGAGTTPAPAGTLHVLAISQSKEVTWNSTFTIAMRVANTSGIQFVYFTFCQLTSPVCYAPVVMNLTGTDWYVGTTKPMTQYPGMTPGVVAGYNITVEFNDGTNATEPRLPNTFANLTVTTSVSGEYMFEMSVHRQVYDVRGIVTDAATGQSIVGATVALTPGTNSTVTGASGAFVFAGLPNGTYQLSVAHAGYDTSSATVVVQDQNATKNIALTNASSGPGGHPSGSSTASGAAPTYLLLGAGAAVVAAGAAIAVLLARRRAGGGT